MGRRSKQSTKNRAKSHRAQVKAGHKMRKRRARRGLHPASVRRKRRAERRKKK